MVLVLEWLRQPRWRGMQCLRAGWLRRLTGSSLVLGFLVAGLPVIGWAATPEPSDSGGVGLLLANASPLTIAEMAGQTGTGLVVSTPSIQVTQPQARVRLWDELHQPVLPDVQNQAVTFTVRVVP